MKINSDSIVQSILRFLIVSGVVIIGGYLVYEKSVFISTQWPYQFFSSGITLGIAYAAFCDNHIREGIAMLLGWYLILTLSPPGHNSWLFILFGAYVILIAYAVYYYLRIIKKSFASNSLVRIIIACVLIAVTNSIIVLVLVLITLPASSANLVIRLEGMFLNLKIGAGLGLLFGFGAELADYVAKTYMKQKKVVV